MLRHLDKMVELAKAQHEKKTVAVAAAHDENVLSAVLEAQKLGIAEGILVGDKKRIIEIIEKLGGNPEQFVIVPADGDTECAARAVEFVNHGDAQFLMKGLLGTADLMRAVIDKEKGLRTGKLLSSIMILDSDKYPKLLCLTDGGMCTFPSLDQKKEILKNAAGVMNRLGYRKIYAACICGAEKVNQKIQSTVDADELSKMTDEWKPYGMSVYGPVGLDLAISKDSCRHKHFSAEGAGEADILLVPTYEVGNGIGKAMIYFGSARNAGIIVGAKVPIVLVSRSDSAESKLYSIALASITS